jgi:pyruvate dehydrogenase E2 component (dihydrolipoamide acetyltransferase)
MPQGAAVGYGAFVEEGPGPHCGGSRTGCSAKPVLWGDAVARLLRMPELADDPSSATLTAWLVGERGDFVGAQSIATVETASSLLSIEVAEPGVLIKSLVAPGQPVEPGSPLAVLGAPGEVIEDVEQLMVQLGLAVAPEAQEAGAHLRAVPPHDALYATTWPPHEHEPVEEEPQEDEKWATALVQAASAERAAATDEPVVVRRVVGWADTLAEAVVDAVQVVEALPSATAAAPAATVRQVQLRDDVRVDELLSVVSKVDGVSMLGLAVKAIAVTSRHVPLHPDASSMAAVAIQRWTRTGTVAPVVHVANLMTASSLSATVAELDARAREGRLASAELEPASVTVVDLGTEGVAEGHLDATAAHPAVLAIGAVRVRPVVDGGQLVPGRVVTLSLSCDASRIEAGTAARWLAHLAGLLEQPLQFLT